MNKVSKNTQRQAVGSKRKPTSAGRAAGHSAKGRKGKNTSVSSLFNRVGSRLFWIVIAAITLILIVFVGKVVIDRPFSIIARYGAIKYPNGDVRGIDISHYQREIDWEKLQNAQINGVPVRFIFVKATEGSDLLDENFNENFYQAHKHGITRGAYHFFSVKSTAKAQARWFCKMVWLDDDDLPPVLDIETDGGLPPYQLRAQALQWLDLVEKHYGVPPILYTSYAFRRKYLYTPEFDRYPYWIAHYYVDSLRYKGEWKFWQHTDRGTVDGIDYKVDLNVFNGSYDDLMKLTIGATRKQ